MPAELNDETLMLTYRDGDLQAFRELYRRHSQALYVFIAWRSPRREWVNEIVQDSWANLHQARARYEPRASFRTFLFQIARNRLVDQIRQHGRLVLASELHHEDWAETLVADGPSPEASFEEKEQNIRLYAALRALPDEQREALVLQQFSGMSLDEIAQLVDAPVETIKSRLRYAMKKMRQQLEVAALKEQTA